MKAILRLSLLSLFTTLLLSACSESANNPTCDDCKSPSVCVNGVCVDNSVQECQVGDNTCKDSLTCVDGRCLCPVAGDYKSCGQGLTCCSSGCVDLTADNINCKTCNTKCDAGSRCVNSNCVPETIECTNDEERCFENNVQICDRNMWVNKESCTINKKCDPISLSCVESECSNGEYTCEQNNLMICKLGVWKIDSQCSEGTQQCNADSAKCDDISKCTDGETKCLSNVLQTCQNDQFVDTEICLGTCTLTGTVASCTCAENTHICDGNTLKQCKSNQWNIVTTCTDGTSCNDTLGECSSLCNNGAINVGEECDGSDLNNKICADVVVGSSGTLKCSSSCKFDTSQCVTVTPCTPPEKKCVGEVYMECNPDGTWEELPCPADTPACDLEDYCVECTSNTHCKTAPKLVCDTAAKVCVECKSNADCTNTSKPNCNTSTNICEPASSVEETLLKVDSFSGVTTTSSPVRTESKFSTTNVLAAGALNVGPWTNVLNFDTKAVVVFVGPVKGKSQITVSFKANRNTNANAPKKLKVAIFEGSTKKHESKEFIVPVDSAQVDVEYTQAITGDYNSLAIRIVGYDTGVASPTGGTLRIIPPLLITGK